MRQRRIIFTSLAATFFVVGLVPTTIYVKEFLAIDRCLDQGGVFDYELSKCRYDVDRLPTITFTERHPLMEAVAVIGFALGLVFAMRIPKRGWP